ncbi:MAG: cache domain-containing protein [Rhodobacteraceae bacterium]|nr:cache domain-containing protein [Paracoccaceae bacterium]
MRLNLKAAATLAALALIVLSSGTSGAAPTAAQVRDDETLKAFVEGAKAHIESLTNVDEILGLKSELRTEGTWKAGPVFIIVFFPSGAPFVHPGDRTAEGKNLLGVEDERGKRVVEDLFATAARGGGFVTYQDGGQKTAYAVEYVSGMTGRRLVLVGGYAQDVSHVPDKVADLPKPAVTASQVVDRETLIAFVEAAAEAYRAAVMSKGYRDVAGVRNAFRVEGGDWRSGSIYLWVVSGSGIILFHATESFREGRPSDMTRTDINGVRFAEELIGSARREGSKFLRYHYDNPTIEGDEDTGSAKLGFAVSVGLPNTDQKLVIGSGIYLDTDDR